MEMKAECATWTVRGCSTCSAPRSTRDCEARRLAEAALSVIAPNVNEALLLSATQRVALVLAGG